MKEIHLHGSLGAHFGERFSLDVRDPAEAVRALTVQLPGFRSAIEANNWHVIRGPLESGDDLDEDGLTVALGNQHEIHIMPAVEGAGEVFNVIAGAALIAVGVLNGFNPYLISAGAGMAIGGVVQMTTSVPGSNYNERESPAERPSFLFDGPVNTSTQGLPVPVIYGRVRVGSVVISAGMTAEELDE
ncbi:hypothetical protein [Halomonas sp. Mc5H-6]|uniref:hypothetical protein n=1 Tax=Halomonas sp. Mc5H-6 TaxID=2954500 RepID=UPI002096AA28|nr:hypothetical protein [Halomonas sp. Mc5H-6]MCO7246350.1 hypothetical protein [Halomonas sp. Mc5H-6]